MIWPHLILIVFNLINSRVDAYRILKDKTIAHGINFGAYAIVATACIFIFHMTVLNGIIFLLSAFFNRQITFDIPLNLRRGLSAFYMSTANPPKAWLDRQERKIVGYNGKLLTVIYAVLWVAFLLIYFL